MINVLESFLEILFWWRRTLLSKNSGPLSKREKKRLTFRWRKMSKVAWFYKKIAFWALSRELYNYKAMAASKETAFINTPI